jgi:hypothetical protein
MKEETIEDLAQRVRQLETELDVLKANTPEDQCLFSVHPEMDGHYLRDIRVSYTVPNIVGCVFSIAGSCGRFVPVGGNCHYHHRH